MSGGLYLGVRGGSSALRALDVAANNLANAQTTGFKADRAVFELAPTGDDASSPGAALRTSSAVDLQAGTARTTDEPLDMAIDGPGFFQLREPGGATVLTRAGAFTLNAAGEIAARDGALLLSRSGGTIRGDGGDVEIAADGSVTVGGEGRGRIAVVDVDPAALEKRGGTRFVALGEVVEAEGVVAQGRLEGSNVDPVSSLVELIALQRYYEAFQQTARATDGMDQQLASRVGRKND